jgi:N-acetylmuramoyl-L-alanine amidase
MKLASVCFLLVILSLAFVPHTIEAAPRRQTVQRVSGPAYVRLTEWARSHDFELRWLKKDETLQLTRQSARLVFTVDSNDADVNGVGVRLLFPIAIRDGVPCLSQLDAQMTLDPILSPPRSRRGASVTRICLDAGHGGIDSGNRVRSFQEKTYTLLLAQELATQLTRAGYKVTLTRDSDRFIELSERAAIAKRRSADLFISLHFNSAPNSASTVRGAEVYCMTPVGAPSTNARGEGSGAGWYPGNRLNDKNVYLAYQLQKSVTKTLGTEDRGLHRARFAVLRDAVMPAVLIEAGFMSNPAEGRKIFDFGYRKQIAKAIVDGVGAYRKGTEQRGS